MNKKFVAVLAAATAMMAVGAHAQSAWSTAATQDLQAIHDNLRDNSPEAYIDRDSATYRSWLEEGLKQAMAQPLGKVDNAAAYADAIRFYTTGFHDPNIGMTGWTGNTPWFAAAWPGFSTAYRNGAYVVAYVDPSQKGLPPVGAKVISCDKVPAETIAKQKLDRYEGDLSTANGRFETAPYLLWDRANTMVSNNPAKCDFEVNGRKRTFTIIENLAPEDQAKAAFQAAAPKPSGLAMEAFGQGGFWINVHSFEDSQNWTAFLAQIDQYASAIRTAPVVVIDFRGADSGAVRNGYRLVNRLWDPDYILSMNPPATDIEYRASKANRDFYASIAQKLAGDPMTAMEAPRWQELADALGAAMTANQPILKRNESSAPQAAVAAPMQLATTLTNDQVPGGANAPGSTSTTAPAGAAAPAAPPPPAAPPAPPTNPMKAKVIILTDYWCAGPCLNMMDLLTRLPNVSQAGVQTGADSIYIGQASQLLPSGHARIAYGDKGWMDRPRPSGQPYAPAAGMAYTGDLADEAALKAWVATLAH
jgi:hypothetical protein